MSRTVKGSKSPGFEYWGKRPSYGIFPPGKLSKRLTHKAERKRWPKAKVGEDVKVPSLPSTLTGMRVTMGLDLLYGLRVVVHPDVPKMQLSLDCPVTDEYRKDTNAWMIRFFGMTNLISNGSVYRMGDTLTMNPRTWEQIKKAVQHEQR